MTVAAVLKLKRGEPRNKETIPGEDGAVRLAAGEGMACERKSGAAPVLVEEEGRSPVLL